MKWFNAKKYKTCVIAAPMFVRVVSTTTDHFYFAVAEFDAGIWIDKETDHPIENKDFYISHFTIPDPVERD